MKKNFRYIVLMIITAFCISTVGIVLDGLTDDIAKADMIVILGNKVEFNGSPSVRLQSRLDKGLELYKQGYAPLILVTGGIGKEGFDEAEVMKAYLVEKGLDPTIIIVDSEGVDTYSSAQNTKKIAEQENLNFVIVVSNYYHISRTKLAFKKAGIGTVYSAHANYFELRDLYSISREVIGYGYYLVRRY